MEPRTYAAALAYAHNPQRKPARERLRYLRSHLMKLSQHRFAKHTEIPQALVSRYESGARVPTLEIAVVLERVAFQHGMILMPAEWCPPKEKAE